MGKRRPSRKDSQAPGSFDFPMTVFSFRQYIVMIIMCFIPQLCIHTISIAIVGSLDHPVQIVKHQFQHIFFSFCFVFLPSLCLHSGQINSHHHNHVFYSMIVYLFRQINSHHHNHVFYSMTAYLFRQINSHHHNHVFYSMTVYLFRRDTRRQRETETIACTLSSTDQSNGLPPPPP